MQRILITGITEHGGAHADADARLVHHVEHVAQALVRLADQITDRPALLAEIEHGRSGATPAHLVQQPGQRHIVARAEAAVGVDQKLRHDEQRNPLHPSRCALDPRQHQMHDVVTQLVIAAGNENLVAADAVAAIGLRLGRGAQIPSDEPACGSVSAMVPV